LYPGRAGTTVVSEGVFRQPNGNPLNLVLYSDGALYQEDVANAPGVITNIASVTPGCRMKLANAFGRAYMAFSDGNIGTDVPRQYDGTNFDRLTQDGPGAAPACAPYSSTSTITSIANVGESISAITTSTNVDAATATLVVTTSAAHGLLSGQYVSLVGVPLFNGVYLVTGVPSTTSFTVTYAFVPLTTTAYSVTTPSVGTLTFGQNHNLLTGDTILVTGNPNSGLNGVYTIASVPSSTQITYHNGSANDSGGGGATVMIQTLVERDSVGVATQGATITLSAAPSNVAVGDTVYITGSVAGDSTHPYDSNTGGNPATWSVTAVSGSTVTISTIGITGLNGSNGSTTGGTATFGGSSSAGTYQCVQMFLTRNGALTKPSPPVAFSSQGNQKVNVTDLAIGPPNVVARVLAFTAAGGSNFFTIPTAIKLPSNIPGTDQILVAATVVPDNTSTSAIMNFSDNALLSATGIGIPGNNLFEQQTLGPCIGVFAYASRLAAWGMPNLLPNLLNMGFDGGYISSNVPTGWTVVTSGGALTTTGVEFGFAWQITGDGTSNPKGQISQSVYQDYLNVAILQGATKYTFRAWLTSTGTAGDVIADLYSATDGVLATATIALAEVGTAGKFFQADFNAATPGQIPADAVLRVYAKNQASSDVVKIDECELFPTAEPQFPQALFSYIENPESFDGVTGVLGPDDDPTPILAMSQLRGTLNIHTKGGLYGTNDSPNNEPADWEVPQISATVGALSPWSVDAGQWGTGIGGEQWGFIASRDGLYIYWGAEPRKVSQEIQSVWNNISWPYCQNVWVQCDLANQRVFVGLPLNGIETVTAVYVLDFRELTSAPQIADSPPIHISFTGKMIASDLTRKWNSWNLALNCGALLALSLNLSSVCFGGGAGGNGNAYQLGAYFSTDDDYGQISPFYWTYGFVSREEEQQLGVGGFEKMYPFATAYVSGVGTMTLTPATESLANVWPAPPAWPLAIGPAADLQFGLNVEGARCFFKVASLPVSGQTDNGFLLQKLVVGIRSNPSAPFPMAS
jgi:hypothetical protein